MYITHSTYVIRDTRRRFVDRKPDGRESKAGYVCRRRNRKDTQTHTHTARTETKKQEEQSRAVQSRESGSGSGHKQSPKWFLLVINTSKTQTRSEISTSDIVRE